MYTRPILFTVTPEMCSVGSLHLDLVNENPPRGYITPQ